MSDLSREHEMNLAMHKFAGTEFVAYLKPYNLHRMIDDRSFRAENCKTWEFFLEDFQEYLNNQ